MSKKRKANRAKKIGLPPGSLVYFGEKEKLIDIDVISYSDSSFYTQKVGSAQEALSFINEGCITWININGLNNIEEIRKIGAYTHLNNLLLEDVLDTQHRPKVELLEEHLLVIIKMIYHQGGQLSHLLSRVRRRRCLRPYTQAPTAARELAEKVLGRLPSLWTFG